MSKHTPGPWHFDGDVIIYASNLHKVDHKRIGVSSRIVAYMHAFQMRAGDEDELQANAKLIAAAPETAAERDRLKELNAELLAALKALYEATPDNEGGELGRACIKARAAITETEARS